MDKTTVSITQTDNDGNISEDFLFTYSEEEKQQNEINRANAQLVLRFKYLTVPREVLQLGLGGNETLIFCFIDSWLCEHPSRFYFSNKTLANVFNLSEVGVSNILTKLKNKGLINVAYRRKADGGQIRYVNLPTYKNFKYQLKETLSTNLKKVSGNNNKISNNKISNNTLSKDKEEKSLQERKQFGNADINTIIQALKETFNLPMLDGSVSENRRYAYLMMQKYKTLDAVLNLIQMAKRDEFWKMNISSVKSLYYNGVKIAKKNGAMDFLQETTVKPKIIPETVVHELSEEERQRNLIAIKEMQAKFSNSARQLGNEKVVDTI